MKVGIIIPCTSKDRDWQTVEQSYLYDTTIKTFALTYNKDYNYTFYIGIDKNDRIYDNDKNKTKLKQFCSVLKNIDIKFLHMDGIKKGHLTLMWNVLFEAAYNDQCDYFFQCGDDIKFTTSGWIDDCIITLKNNNNIGMTGPMNNNDRILTQSFVSRKHMELFGYFFPPEIINWGCDDWINLIYKGINAFFPLRHHFCDNIGGKPRYLINNEKDRFQGRQDMMNMLDKVRNIADDLAKRDIKRINEKLINV
jgi:hypothetical protein